MQTRRKFLKQVATIRERASADIIQNISASILLNMM